MTIIYGPSGSGGTTGLDGGRTIVNYTYAQNVAGNYTDVTWSYGLDYGDPDYWVNVSNRSVAWSVSTGASVSGISGSGTGASSAGTINTSDPGYGGQIHYFYTGVVRIFHNSSGQGTIHLAATMDFHSSAYTSAISSNIALPDIVQAPTAPGAPAPTRVSDTQITLAWTNNSATHKVYASQNVQRSVNGGSYATIASGLSGSATSYSDTSTSANHRYAYKIQAVNAAATTTSAAGASVYTTPGTPTIGAATKQPNGDIVVTWTNNVGYADTTYGVTIYESQNGGSFTSLATVAGGVATYTHAAPSTSVTHAYKVAATKGALTSAQSAATNTVTLLATANAPTGLAPSGAAQDAAGAIVLTWTHNPADGTPQSKRHVQAKIDAGSYADLVNDSSTTNSYTVTAATWTNGHTITWKVATAGQNGTLSAYSAESSFALSTAPTVNINSPGTTYATSALMIAWGYFQAQSSIQASWEARLYDAGSVLLESLSGTTEVAATFATVLANGAAYTVKMTVTSAVGVRSAEDTQAFTVSYALPAAVAVAAAFDNAAGFTVVTVTGGAAVTGYTGLVVDGTIDAASTPDASALDIAANIDIRVDLSTATWVPAAQESIIGKWLATGNQRSYEVVLTSGGLLALRITTDGSTIVTATSSVAPSPVNNRLSIRVARVSSTVTFYTSTTTDLTGAVWTQLGTTATAAGSIFNSTALLQVGSDAATTGGFVGTVYSAEIRDNSAAVVANPNFSIQPAGTPSFVDGHGLTWTLIGSATISQIVASAAAIATVDVQRQINNGDWVTVATGIVLDLTTYAATVQDTVPATVGTNTYRAIAYSALPSSIMSDPVDVTTDETVWGYLSGGVGFATVARLRAMPTFAPQTSRAKALYHFAGRPKPVQLSGEALTSTLSVSGSLTADSGTAADFEALGLADGVHCWRGPDGRRMFGSLDKVSTSVTRAAELPGVSFAVTELDFTEGDQ